MKRLHSDQDAQLRSDGSSNGMENTTDAEMDLGPSDAPSAQNTRQVREKNFGDGAAPSTPLLPPPPKKKRTRTLTTPHQSAVLHALLAQSRFPTTAMREEVGRSIGLSARKVQVWFQNQRQKARRPRDSKKQGSPVAPARPPQYGAFPNVPASAFVQTSAYSTVDPSTSPSDGLYATAHSAPAPSVQFNLDQRQQPDGSSNRLSGPGVPGVASAPANLSSSSSFVTPPRFPHTPQREQQMQMLAPLADPSPRDAQSISSSSSARQGVPSRDFTFNHPFPPFHLQAPETGGALLLGGSQNQYPTMTPLRPLTASSHHSLGLSSSSGRPRSQQTSSSSSPSSPSSPFAPAFLSSASTSVSKSRPQTPVSSFLVPRRRDLPRLQIPPLHVPESPNTNPQASNAHARAHVHVHVQQHQHQPQRSAPPRHPSPPLSLPLLPPPPHSHQDPAARFSRPTDRALPGLLLSTTSSAAPRPSRSTSRGGGGGERSPVSAHAPMSAPASASAISRAKRFDPVREAASECSRSGSLGTDSMSTGTPPRIDTPQHSTTPFT